MHKPYESCRFRRAGKSEKAFKRILSFRKIRKGIQAYFALPENPKGHFKCILPFRKIRKGISSVFCPSGKSGKAFQAYFALPENPERHFMRILPFRKIRKGISNVTFLLNLMAMPGNDQSSIARRNRRFYPQRSSFIRKSLFVVLKFYL